MIENIYYSLHRLATPKHDRNSTVAPGYWQFKVRQAALKACRNIQGNILDIGCGDGLFLAQLVQQNLSARIWAIDISAETIQYARQRLMNQNISSVNFYSRMPLPLILVKCALMLWCAPICSWLWILWRRSGAYCCLSAASAEKGLLSF